MEHKLEDYQVAEIKSAFNAQIAAEALGLEIKRVGSTVSILCPSHDDHRFGSCNYNSNTGQFTCYVCQERFSGIDLVMKLRGCRFLDAIEFAADQIGYTLIKKDDTDQEKKNLLKALPSDIARIIGMAVSTDRIYEPVASTYDKSEAIEFTKKNPGGRYREEEILVSRSIDGEDDEYVTHYILCMTYPNPSVFLHEQNPSLYAQMAAGKLLEKAKELRRTATQVITDYNNLCNPSSDVKYDYVNYLFELQEIHNRILKEREYYVMYLQNHEGA